MTYIRKRYQVISLLLYCLSFNSLGYAGSPDPIFIVGVGTHVTGGGRPMPKTVGVIHELGIGSVRDDATWNTVEREAGKLVVPKGWDDYVDALLREGIHPLLILDYGNLNYDGNHRPRSPNALAAYARYAGFVAAHFANRVAMYEIWNEWDLKSRDEPQGTADEYLRLVQATVPAIRKANPGARIFAGSGSTAGIQSGFVDQLLRGGILNWVDGLSLHPYIHCERRNTPEDWANWMSGTSQRTEKLAGRPVPLYFTEMAWPSHTGPCGVSEQRQATYLVRMFLLGKAVPNVRGIWWYDLQNDGTNPNDPQHNFGLVNYDFVPKPAYHAIKGILPLIAYGRYLGRVDTRTKGVSVLRFESRAGMQVLAAWTESPDLRAELTFTSNAPVPSLTLAHAESASRGTLPWRCSSTYAAPRVCKISVGLSDSPVFIGGPLSFTPTVTVETR